MQCKDQRCQSNIAVQVIIFHLNQIGDFCFSLPLVNAIERRYPQSQICSVVRPHLVPLAQRAKPVDVIAIRPEAPTIAYLTLLRQLRARHADLAIVLPTSPGPSLLARLCGARRIVAFDDDWPRYSIVERIPYDNPPSLANNLRMAECVADEVPKRDYVGLMSATEHDRTDAGRILAGHGVRDDQSFVVFAASASSHRLSKCWPTERFAALATMLWEQAGLYPVFVGSVEETESVEALTSQMSVPAANLTGHTDTGQLLGVLARASLFIGQDSGPTHLSAALGRPTLAIFGPTDPQLTAPLGESSAVVYKNLPCSPCHEQAAECPNRKCLLSIEPEEVAEQALSLMEHAGAPERMQW